MVMAGLFLVSIILWAFGREWCAVSGFLSAAYCVTLMATDLFSSKNGWSHSLSLYALLCFIS